MHAILPFLNEVLISAKYKTKQKKQQKDSKFG